MDTTTIYLLIAVIGCIVGVYGVVSTRDKHNEANAVWRGEVNGKLDALLGIESRVKTLEDKVTLHETKISFIEKSNKRLHERLDEQIIMRDESQK